jgi:D-ribose pyranose/furanose isomerase RbsD
MRQGIKHTIECHCTLPQFRSRNPPVYHKFIVFSIIDESGTAIPKEAKCNNCGTVHRVFDLKKSEIISGREASAVISIEDIKLMIPSQLSSILESYGVDTATWEQALFFYNESMWGSNVILTRELDTNTGAVTGKLVELAGQNRFAISTYSYETVFNKR